MGDHEEPNRLINQRRCCQAERRRPEGSALEPNENQQHTIGTSKVKSTDRDSRFGLARPVNSIHRRCGV
jgi:hypothetical protein